MNKNDVYITYKKEKNNYILTQKIRVLHVINGMGSGGAEKDIMNWYRHIDRNIIQFDFLIRSNQLFYAEEIKKLGGQIHQVSPFPTNIIKNYLETKKIIKEKATLYNAIHVHGNTLIYIIPLFLAKKYKIKNRIMHIHNTKSSSKIGNIIHTINRKFIHLLSTCRIACSKKAGEFGFKKDYIIINNAINIKEYDLEKNSIKQKFNNEFNIESGSLILGHVGRFLPVKNQKFILSCYKYISRYKKSALICVGEGPLKDALIKQAQDDHLQNVFFIGERKDVPELLNYFDIMIFPSLYEGVPLVPLEAQAAKLKILCSDRISDDIYITEYARKYSLNNSTEHWVKEILNFMSESVNDDIENKFSVYGYDIKSILTQLINIWR